MIYISMENVTHTMKIKAFSQIQRMWMQDNVRTGVTDDHEPPDRWVLEIQSWSSARTVSTEISL